jgi:hypothetical protein
LTSDGNKSISQVGVYCNDRIELRQPLTVSHEVQKAGLRDRHRNSQYRYNSTVQVPGTVQYIVPGTVPVLYLYVGTVPVQYSTSKKLPFYRYVPVATLPVVAVNHGNLERDGQLFECWGRQYDDLIPKLPSSIFILCYVATAVYHCSVG